MPTVDSVQVTGGLGIPDLARYQYYRSLRRMGPLVLGVTIAELIGLLFLLIVDDSNAIPFVVLLACWLVLFFVLPYWNARKLYIDAPAMRESTSLAFTESGIQTHDSERIAWSAIREIQETGSLFLIYTAPDLAILLPKRYFASAGAIDEWRSRVTHWMGKPIASTALIGKWC